MRVESLLIQFVTIFLYILKTKSEGIMCYRCVSTFSGHDASEKLCSQFNGNKTFQVFCPMSTFCVNKTIYYKSQTSMVKIVERGCATQRYLSKIYNNITREWYDKEEVIKAYEEGCTIGEDRGATGKPPEYCYCNSDLCNFSPSIKSANLTTTIFLLTLSLLFVNFLHV